MCGHVHNFYIVAQTSVCLVATVWTWLQSNYCVDRFCWFLAFSLIYLHVWFVHRVRVFYSRWFVTPASISSEQPIIYHHFAMMGMCGLWQLHYSLFAI